MYTSIDNPLFRTMYSVLMNFFLYCKNIIRTMHIHIATLGKNTDPVIKGFRGISGIDKAYIIYSSKYQESADEVEDFLEKANIPATMKPIDEYDFSKIMDCIVDINNTETEKGVKKQYSINVTGGTKIMGFAAYSSAYFIGATVYYVKETDDNTPIEKQIMTLMTTKPPKQSKTEKKFRTILNFIQEETSANKVVTSTKICDKFGFTKQQVAYYIKNMREDGMITVSNGIEDNGKMNYSFNSIKLTQQGQMIAKFTRNK